MCTHIYHPHASPRVQSGFFVTKEIIAKKGKKYCAENILPFVYRLLSFNEKTHWINVKSVNQVGKPFLTAMMDRFGAIFKCTKVDHFPMHASKVKLVTDMGKYIIFNKIFCSLLACSFIGV